MIGDRLECEQDPPRVCVVRAFRHRRGQPLPGFSLLDARGQGSGQTVHDRSPEIDGEVDTPSGKPQGIRPGRGIGINEGDVRGDGGDAESKILSQAGRCAAGCLSVCLGGDMRLRPREVSRR